MDSPQTMSPFGFEDSRTPLPANAPFGPATAASLLPGNAIDAQKAICDAVALLVKYSPPGRPHLDAFMALERQAQQVGNRLLTQYVEGDAHVRLMEWNAWQSANHLSRCLIHACQHFLPHIASIDEDSWIEREHGLLVLLFYHVKFEFLLRFLRYKRRSDEQWRQLHGLYRSARERDLRHSLDSGDVADVRRRPTGNLECQYLQILLLEAMNCGRFSPREALWAHRWFARWCRGAELQLEHADAGALNASRGFVVDIGGSDGLQRGPASGANYLCFDPSPLLVLIDREADALRDGVALPFPVTPAVRAGQLALLRKLAILFAQHPVEVERRAERRPVAMAVQAIAGFPLIVEELRQCGLRNDGRSAELAGASLAPSDEEIVAPAVDGMPDQRPGEAEEGAESLASRGGGSNLAQHWQVKDRSDSGCRMRGQIANMNRVIPGSLIALREDGAAPWTVAVVRWFRRLMVDHVEIGVEYLGRRPRFVKMVADGSGDFAVDEVPGTALRCFAALYLPPSEGHPTMPIKTLLLPAGEFKPGCEVMLLSSSATYRMRLNEPIQQQYEFVLTSFGLLEATAPLAAGAQ